jgi:hypothetical protein
LIAGVKSGHIGSKKAAAADRSSPAKYGQRGGQNHDRVKPRLQINAVGHADDEKASKQPECQAEPHLLYEDEQELG